MSVTEDFKQFCDNLKISSDKRSSIATRYERITKRLNLDFWDSSSNTYHSRYVGSYGRGTATNGFSDLDVLFELPTSIYYQYNSYQGNGQSALLGDFRDSLKKTYTTSSISGDGQVVVIHFDDGITFEILPAFETKDGDYIHPDSNDGGSWKVTNPIAEISEIGKEDEKCNGNLRNLCKMARAWRDMHNLSMGGLLIDTLAYNFLGDYPNKEKSYLYYDYIVRDFFLFLSEQDEEQEYWLAPGSKARIKIKDKFQYKAKQAYNKSLSAITLYQNNHEYTARQNFREIFGTNFPK